MLRMFLIMVLMLLLSTPPGLSVSYASSPLEKLTDIQSRLKTRIRQAGSIKKREKSIAESIAAIEADIRRREKEMARYNREISRTREKIRELNDDIETLRENLDKRTGRLRDYVRMLYKQRLSGNALFLVSASDYQDLVRRSKYVNMLAYNESRIVKDFSGDIIALKNRMDELKSLKADLDAKRKYLDRKKTELLKARQKKDRLLARVRDKRTRKEKEIKELSEASRKLQDMIHAMAGKKIPASILGKGFKSMKGHLPWPMRGKVITDRELIAASMGSGEGVLIQASSDGKVRAVAGGRVVYAGSFSGYGKLMIIDHGNGYHTLYGNLKDFFIEEGDLLIEGMEIGSAEKMEETGAETLYFEIRYKGRPVDPSGWMKKRRGYNA
jgi:septal ring factor EnvC (AmiA/AmiB activator)